MSKFNIKLLKFPPKERKRLFLFYGIINFLLTNLVLQLMILITSIFLATILGQITNLVLGFYLYGKKVFKSNKLTFKEFSRYISLASFNWIVNFISIRFLYENGINKNLAALFTIPFLVLISYYFQKKYVFIKIQ